MLKLPPAVPKQLFRRFSGERKFELVRLITKDDVENFGKVSGDTNPIHFEGDRPIVHGALLIGIVSGIIGTKCPGPGVKVVALESSFKNSCPVNSSVKFSVEIVRQRKIIDVAFRCDAVDGSVTFMDGSAKLVK